MQRSSKRSLISNRRSVNMILLIHRATSYNPDADVPMTETDLSPLLSKPNIDGKKDKKEKKEKKRPRREMEEENDEFQEREIKKTKSNGVEETSPPKKEKSKSKKD